MAVLDPTQDEQRFQLEPNIMRYVALGMADGQIEQADALLCDPWRVVAGRPPRGRTRRYQFEVALEHMRSACKWLIAAAENT